MAKYKYEGEYNFEGVREGNGRATYANGDIYEGQYANGKRHGRGKYTFAQGGEYKGEWNNGKIHGKGVFTYPDGTKYEGKKPKVKSQPVPKKSSGPVTVVVGQTFEKIVLDKKKDVLIELYAPWCGYCKSLEPIYKDLAKKLKIEKNLVIAKMDATANDSPTNYPSRGFPTIFFAPSNKKDSPISYNGERTLDGMMQFLKEHATVSLGKTRKEERRGN